jgi:hypothetical protein
LKNISTITILVIIIVIVSAFSAMTGILSSGGPGPYTYKSLRGHEVLIYGKGLYKDMSAEVAPQGIAHDYVILFAGIPLLIFSLFLAGKNSIKGRFMLTGVLLFFLVTYLFYLMMGMYNQMFLAYVVLLCCSFFAFLFCIFSFNTEKLPLLFNEKLPVKFTGGFLIFSSISIAFLWLSIVIPPILDGTIIPKATEHYTTLVVQGLDLSIMLPSAFVSGYYFVKRKPAGFLLAPVTFVFLCLLMTALCGKIIAMANAGYNVFPVIFIIPSFTLISIFCTVMIFRHMKNTNPGIAA